MITRQAHKDIVIKGEGAPWRRVILRAYADLCDCKLRFMTSGQVLILGPNYASITLCLNLYDSRMDELYCKKLFDEEAFRLEEVATNLRELVDDARRR